MALCKNLTFEECELAILRRSVDKITKEQGTILMNEPETKKMLEIVVDFIVQNDLLLYGGTAINAMLPKSEQFYDYRYELPDYDAYSPNAMDDAVKLADIFFAQGFKDVEAKSGVHHGTYKVFVNQHSIADLTYIHPDLYLKLKRAVNVVDGLRYVPVNYLRMSCYLELSRPMGDVSRWEKVYKRLSKLNKYHPLVFKKCKQIPKRRKFTEKEVSLFNTALHTLASEDVIFIGAYANKLYTNHSDIPNVENVSEFDVISSEPEKTCQVLMTALTKVGFFPRIVTHPEIGELIHQHHSIMVDDQTVAIVFSPVGCHSYNVVVDKYHNSLRLGTIDTLFSYYLAFLYAERDYLDGARIECICSVLYKVQQDNRLTNKKPLQRFNIQCYGTQETLASMREKRNEMLQKLVPGTRLHSEWFLKYTPQGKRKGKKETKGKGKPLKQKTRKNTR
jgi:hypothetical protein